MAGSSTHIALLRGINVGGHNKLPMKSLAAIFENAGCREVRTYIQSGNVVFTAEPELAERIPAAVNSGIAASFGYDIELMTRTAAQMAEIVRANPFVAPGVDEKTLHIAFLADEPEPGRVAGLDAERSPGDRFVVLGREIYISCPGGLARTKLSNAWFDRQLATTSTMRNWRTTLKLLAMTGG